MTTFNKEHLAGIVQERGHLTTKIHAETIVNMIFDEITNILVNKGEINISKFGKIYTKTVKAKQARNPKTGEKVSVSEHLKVVFRPSIALKHTIN
jgi:nucleoid DNA-binding protein